MKANAIFAVLGLSISIIVARELGPLFKGELTLFLLVSSIFSLSMRFGLDTSIIRYLKNEGANFSLAKNSMYLALMIIFSLLFLLYLLTSYFDNIFYFFNNQKYYYFLYVLIPLEVIGILIASYLLGSNKIAIYSVSIILQPALLLIMLGVFLIFGVELDVWNVITLTVISFFIKLIYLIYKTRHLFSSSERYSLNKSLGLFRFGLKSHIGNIIDFFIIRTDILLIAFFIGIEAVGVYSIAALAEKVNIISGSIGSAIFSKIKSSNDSSLVNQIIRLTLPFLLMIIFLAIILSEYFILLIFGESFQNAIQPFIILIVGFSVLFISKPIKAYLIVVDRPILLTYSSTLALFCNVIFNILLIPDYGLIGAAIATTLANTIYVICLLGYYKIYALVNFKSVFLLRKNDFKEIFQ
jgi:O-antigen/teichoic acid export membrane protein